MLYKKKSDIVNLVSKYIHDLTNEYIKHPDFLEKDKIYIMMYDINDYQTFYIFLNDKKRNIFKLFNGNSHIDYFQAIQTKYVFQVDLSDEKIILHHQLFLNEKHSLSIRPYREKLYFFKKLNTKDLLIFQYLAFSNSKFRNIFNNILYLNHFYKSDSFYKKIKNKLKKIIPWK